MQSRSQDVVIGFETGGWSGIELTNNPVQGARASGRWKNLPENLSVTSGQIPHDLSGYDGMKLWIHHAGKGPTTFMVVLLSRLDPASFSYFGHRLTVDWDGWKEVVLPFAHFDANHAPAGWDKIDAIRFTVAGWGIQANPSAVLHLENLTLYTTPIPPVSAEQQNALDALKRHFCDFLRQEHPKVRSGADDARIAQWIASLKDDGAWPDIDYADKTRGAWRTLSHLTRLVSLSVAYTSPDSQLHQDPSLSKAIHTGLGHWLRHDYSNPNWWYREVGVPMELSRAMLLLDAELTPRERTAGLRIISRAVLDSPPGRGRGALTGQNRVWVAANSLTQGLLASNHALVQRAAEVIFEEVTVATQAGGTEATATRTGRGQVLLSTQEGIQPDYAFLQHGPLLQLGNYGLSFADNTVLWATVLRKTPFAPGEAKIAIIRDYLLQGVSPVVWKGVMDISACGRQLGPGSPAGKGRAVMQILERAKGADADHAGAYDAALAQIKPEAEPQNLASKNRSFWRADFMVHRRSSFYASTRMSSSRVYGSEVVNGENLQGAYLGDGATFLYRTGAEYEDLFPVWDWSRLPGVTAQSTTNRVLLKPRNFQITNKSPFVGGVSDGVYGAAVMTLDRNGVKAKKAWFFFDDQIVCLGADISGGKPPAPVVSAINQCRAQGGIAVGTADGVQRPSVGRQNYAALKWAWHDHVGYLFPEPQPVTLGIETQVGSWSLVNQRGNPAPIEKKVFSAWFDHGVNPQHAHYSYVLIPGVTQAGLQAQAENPDIQILSNTPAIQAVRHAKLALTQAVFHQPATLTDADGRSLSADAPCLVLLHEKSNTITLADPTQRLSDITLAVNGVSVKHALPTGAMAGSSSTVVRQAAKHP